MYDGCGEGFERNDNGVVSTPKIKMSWSMSEEGNYDGIQNNFATLIKYWASAASLLHQIYE